MKSLQGTIYRPESVELARSQFLSSRRLPQDVEKSPISVREAKKGLKSSLRSSESVGSKPLPEGKSSALRMARSISSSLRTRLRIAFSKPHSNIPPQQLDASKAHFGDGSFSSLGNGGFDTYHDSDLLQWQSTKFPGDPWNGNIAEEDISRRCAIIPVNVSNHSLTESSRSRVTSWTNTTASGSVHEGSGERNRLSVIQEDGGPHQSSCSAGRHLGSIPALRKHLPDQLGTRPDTQQLYSALLRRMNQESADRAKKSIDALEKTESEPQESIPYFSLQSASITSGTKILPPEDQRFHREDRSIGKPEVSLCEGTEMLKSAASEESIYSRTTHGGINAYGGKIPGNLDQYVSAKSLPLCDADPCADIWLDTHNPYEVDVWKNSQPPTDNLATHCLDVKNFQQHAVDEKKNIPDAEQPCGREDSKSAFSLAEKKCLAGGAINAKSIAAASHVRESAQIETDQSTCQLVSADDESCNRAQVREHKAGRKADSTGTLTPSPPPKVPNQLSVTKQRFPPLRVSQVTKKGTPTPSQSNSHTHSQSGLLQEISFGGSDPARLNSEQEKHRNISASLRKISTENIARVLKIKTSTGLLSSKRVDKENRAGPTSSEIVTDGEANATSSPGPVYLAMSSGNSGGKKAHQETKANQESPTNILKANLSARLSRPFNMDIPEGNRPFDNMYLGKRELGFHDTSGDRPSVTMQHHPQDYARQRDLDRGPRGYGGLGPSPLETPKQSEEETALPHIPTPEEDRAKRGSKSGLSLGTRRMVSNFLRSRRKADDSESDGPGVSHEEHATAAQQNTSTSSPLFI